MDKHLKEYLDEKLDLEERLSMLNVIIEGIQDRCNYDQHKGKDGNSYMAFQFNTDDRSFYKCSNCQWQEDYLTELCENQNK